jgi:hypothetical protein
VADLLVELLAVEDCPHLEQARRDLESVLRGSIIEVPIQVVFVSGRDDAEFLGFQGSPTIRINGEDVVPQPELPVAFGCRVYRDAEGRAHGSPPIESIRAAIEKHRRGRLEAFRREEAAKVAEFARAADADGVAEPRAADTSELAREAEVAPGAAVAESSGESQGKPREG